MNYKNQYGSVVLVPIGPKIHASNVIGMDVIDSGCGFDLITAAKISLITENTQLQLVYNKARRQCYLVYHHSSSEVQVCRLEALSSTEDNPHETLARLNKYAANNVSLSGMKMMNEAKR